MVTSIPARERFLKIPKAERDAQDLFFQGEYLLAEGKKAEATAAFQKVVAQFPNSPYAVKAKEALGQAK